MFYIGRFPPPYGGSTNKNATLFEALHERLDIIKFDTQILETRKIYGQIKLLWFIYNNRKKLGVLSISRYSLIKLTKILGILFPKLLNNISVFVVGGIFDEILPMELVNIFNQYKIIFVETNIMVENLKKKGINRVECLTNFRNKNDHYSVTENYDKPIKLVYFGRVCKEKGILYILQAAEILRNKKFNGSIDFYGPISEDVSMEMKIVLESNELLQYKGIFEVEDDNVYNLLNQYDVCLLPTEYIGEGIPGVIVESKISAITTICTQWKNNDDLVTDMKDGIVLKQNTKESLVDAIELLEKDRILLENLKRNALDSAKKYFIENHIDRIIAEIR